MSFKHTLTRSEFVRASMRITFTRPIVILLLLAIVALGIYNYPIFVFRAFYFLMLLCLPLAVWWMARRNYRMSPLAHESLEISFQADALRVSGQSFTLEREWSQINQVRQVGPYVVIWLTNRTTMPLIGMSIPGEDMQMLSAILNIHRHIRTNSSKRHTL